MQQSPHLGNIKVIFFEIDNTLHDNSKGIIIALQKTFHQFKKQLTPITETKFLRAHHKLEKQLIKAYWKNKLHDPITLEDTSRFQMLSKQLKLRNKDLVAKMAEACNRYQSESIQLFPYVKATLKLLKKHYQLAILSNGPSELQRNKLRGLGLYNTFDWILISEDVGFDKPDVKIFQYALRATRAKPDESVMIGNTVDTDLAAKQLGMKTILFDPVKNYTSHEFVEFPPDALVSSYKELQALFLE